MYIYLILERKEVYEMKKLGKKVRKNAGSFKMCANIVCTNCGCGIHSDYAGSKYSSQKGF